MARNHTDVISENTIPGTPGVPNALINNPFGFIPYIQNHRQTSRILTNLTVANLMRLNRERRGSATFLPDTILVPANGEAGYPEQLDGRRGGPQSGDRKETISSMGKLE